MAIYAPVNRYRVGQRQVVGFGVKAVGRAQSTQSFREIYRMPVWCYYVVQVDPIFFCLLMMMNDCIYAWIYPRSQTVRSGWDELGHGDSPRTHLFCEL